MIDIACVGILVADCIAKTVTVVPDCGKLELVDTISLYTGGCATSSAINIAKIGRKSAIIGKVGSDGFGKFMIDSIKGEGVNTKGLVVDENSSTSASLVLVDSEGERSFLH